MCVESWTGDHDWRMTLFWRVFAINGAVVAMAALLLVLTPATVSPDVRVAEALVLGGGVAGVLAINLVLMRRASCRWSASRG